MQFLSGSFMILWMIAFALYYLVPPKMQWYVLLAAGIIFYVAGTGGGILGRVPPGGHIEKEGEYFLVAR